MNTQDATPEVASDAIRHSKERAQELLRDADNCIRANPVPAVLTALGIGFALGLLTRYIEPEPKRDRWQDVLDEIRDAVASSAKRGRKAYAHSADAVRDAVEHAVEKARDIDVDPVAKWWKKLWS
jgi:ElaB/YqjD/DUF883 family membrane-anchored ribosome-binding protein